MTDQASTDPADSFHGAVRSRRRFSLLIILMSLAALGSRQSAYAQSQVANWVNPVSGNWFDVSKWSTNPNVPNGSQFDVVIDAFGANYQITMNSSLSLDSLSVNSASAILNQTSGTLGVSGAIA